MTDKLVRKLRCAIYTRKSSEEGLEMEFNSLDAQRETAEAYILSQKQEGWVLVPDNYDDGGFSGGSMERPALTRLLNDIKNGQIDVVVVYKVDRLSRSLMDFANMMGLFEKYNVSFVSVTQQFNTTTSMGRLMMNILLSFAQFEREVISERIRDKFAASKKKGMWMGGNPPLGYDVKDRKLIINESEAELVRHIFTRYTQLQSMTLLAKELKEEGYKTKSFMTQAGHMHEGTLITKPYLYKLLNNRLYLGEISHKGKTYPGLHQAIIDQALWDKAHAEFIESPRQRAAANRAKTPALLKGILHCGGCQSPMTPSHCRKKGKLYSYYIPGAIARGRCDHCQIGTLPAGEIENAVMQQIRSIVASPECVMKTYKEVRKHDPSFSESDISADLQRIDPLWDELYPAEQTNIVRLLVDKAEVNVDGLDITLNLAGIETLANKLRKVST